MSNTLHDSWLKGLLGKVFSAWSLGNMTD